MKKGLLIGLLIGLLTVLILLSGCESADNNSNFVGNGNSNTSVAIKSANTEILDYLKAPQVDYNECKCIVDYAKVGTTKNVQAVIDSVKEKGTIVFVEVKPIGYQTNSADSIVVVWYKEN